MTEIFMIMSDDSAKEIEIRAHFKRLSQPLADKYLMFLDWRALSQYGYMLKDGFSTKEDAEAYTIRYYSHGMNLLRQ